MGSSASKTRPEADAANRHVRGGPRQRVSKQKSGPVVPPPRATPSWADRSNPTAKPKGSSFRAAGLKIRGSVAFRPTPSWADR